MEHTLEAIRDVVGQARRRLCWVRGVRGFLVALALGLLPLAAWEGLRVLLPLPSLLAPGLIGTSLLALAALVWRSITGPDLSAASVLLDRRLEAHQEINTAYGLALTTDKLWPLEEALIRRAREGLRGLRLRKLFPLSLRPWPLACLMSLLGLVAAWQAQVHRPHPSGPRKGQQEAASALEADLKALGGAEALPLPLGRDLTEAIGMLKAGQMDQGQSLEMLSRLREQIREGKQAHPSPPEGTSLGRDISQALEGGPDEAARGLRRLASRLTPSSPIAAQAKRLSRELHEAGADKAGRLLERLSRALEEGDAREAGRLAEELAGALQGDGPSEGARRLLQRLSRDQEELARALTAGELARAEQILKDMGAGEPLGEGGVTSQEIKDILWALDHGVARLERLGAKEAAQALREVGERLQEGEEGEAGALLLQMDPEALSRLEKDDPERAERLRKLDRSLLRAAMGLASGAQGGPGRALSGPGWSHTQQQASPFAAGGHQDSLRLSDRASTWTEGFEASHPQAKRLSQARALPTLSPSAHGQGPTEAVRVLVEPGPEEALTPLGEGSVDGQARPASAMGSERVPPGMGDVVRAYFGQAASAEKKR